MKKILLIIALVLCIFQMVVLAIAIDIGAACIARPSALASGTFVDRTNPANATGAITSVDIWANINLVNCEVATFFVVAGNNLSTRDTHTIGAVTAGAKRTFAGLDIDVQIGDYIGITFSDGQLERTDDGGGGYWYINDDDHIPCTNQLFTVTGVGIGMSLYGTGETPPGITWNGIVITKWNGQTITIPLNTQ